MGGVVCPLKYMDHVCQMCILAWLVVGGPISGFSACVTVYCSYYSIVWLCAQVIAAVSCMASSQSCAYVYVYYCNYCMGSAVVIC